MSWEQFFVSWALSLSGIAGVLLEFSFKRAGESIWVKNLFLAVFSTPAALYAAIVENAAGIDFVEGALPTISQLTKGFDVVLICVVILLALGGLLSALVMKTAGTLTKCFAVSISIVLCTSVSIKSGSQDLTPGVIVGTFLVVGSVVMYVF